VACAAVRPREATRAPAAEQPERTVGRAERGNPAVFQGLRHRIVEAAPVDHRDPRLRALSTQPDQPLPEPPEGLPERPWFRHAIYAPGQYTGYAAVVIPGVNEAIDKHDLARTRQQIAVLAAALDRATKILEAAR